VSWCRYFLEKLVVIYVVKRVPALRLSLPCAMTWWCRTHLYKTLFCIFSPSDFQCEIVQHVRILGILRTLMANKVFCSLVEDWEFVLVAESGLHKKRDGNHGFRL
jgi:hypothetical protein